MTGEILVGNTKKKSFQIKKPTVYSVDFRPQLLNKLCIELLCPKLKTLLTKFTDSTAVCEKTHLTLWRHKDR